jgi:hypothetical protein
VRGRTGFWRQNVVARDQRPLVADLVAAGRWGTARQRARASVQRAIGQQARQGPTTIEASDGDNEARHPYSATAVVEAPALVQARILEAGASECAG